MFAFLDAWSKNQIAIMTFHPQQMFHLFHLQWMLLLQWMPHFPRLLQWTFQWTFHFQRMFCLFYSMVYNNVFNIDSVRQWQPRFTFCVVAKPRHVLHAEWAADPWVAYLLNTSKYSQNIGSANPGTLIVAVAKPRQGPHSVWAADSQVGYLLINTWYPMIRN